MKSFFNNILDRSIFSKRKLHYEDAISNRVSDPPYFEADPDPDPDPT